MSRTVTLGLGAALVVLVILVLAVIGISGGSGPAAAARTFFETVAQRGPQAAYATASPAFQSATAQDAWAATVQAHGLQQYASSSWTRTGGGDVAQLSGVLTLKSGGSEPVDARMVKGPNGWSLFSLNLPSGGVAGAAASPAGAGDQTEYGNQTAAAAGSGYTAAPPAAYPPPQGVPPLPGYAPPPQGAPYPPPPTGAPSAQASYPAAPGQGQPIVLNRSRVARICGGYVLKQPGVDVVSVHCPDGLSTTPGSSTRCAITVDGRAQTLIATLRSYDAARDDAQLDCRPG